MPKDRRDTHGYVAFAREDVEDARRRRPPGGLEAYAAARGLEMPAISGALGGWRTVMPRFPEYRFNFMWGALPHGHPGLLFHELMTIPEGADGELNGIGGSLWSVRTSTPATIGEALTPRASDLPYVGWLFGPEEAGTDAPFGIAGAWAPTTSFATTVPESVALLPWLHLGQKRRMPRWGSRSLDRFGHAAWNIDVADETPDELIAELVGGGMGDMLRARADDAFAVFALGNGLLKLQRNGYLMSDAGLDAFVASGLAAAQHLQRMGLARARPQPFDAPLAPARWREPPVHEDARKKVFGIRLPSVSVGSKGLGTLGPWYPPAPWPPAFRSLAGRFGLDLEDSEAFHVAFPAQPLPGKALAVMRGTLPGTAVAGRVLYLTEGPAGPVRGAVMLPAPGVPDTPVGGVRDRERQMVWNVRDNIGSAWSLRTADSRLAEEDGLVARAIDIARAGGVAV